MNNNDEEAYPSITERPVDWLRCVTRSNGHSE